MNKNIIHGTMALLFVLVVCISSAAADATVTRDLPATANAGASITVNLTVDIETSTTGYAIDEIVPSGWVVTSAGGGDYWSDPGHIKWVEVSGVLDEIYSYNVTILADATGVCTFSGNYQFEGAAETAILGDLSVTVGSAVDTVTRDLPATANAGASITPTLTVDIVTSATAYAIDEIVPSGWTVTNATDGGDYTTDVGHVKWVVTSGAANTVYSYTVTVPADATGACAFSGAYSSENTTTTAILGDSSVTVSGAEDTTGPTITSVELEPTTVNPGGSVLVTVVATDPSGISSVIADGTVDIPVLTYMGIDTWQGTTTAPDTAGTYNVTVTAKDNAANSATNMSQSFNVVEIQDHDIVTIADVTLGHGTTQDVPIQLLAATGVCGGAVTLTFDQSIVNATNVVVGDFGGLFQVDYSDVGTGTLRITFTTVGDDLTGDQTIATVTLDAVGTSGSCALGLFAELTSKSGPAVPSSVDPGIFTILAEEDTTDPTITSVTLSPTNTVPGGTVTVTVVATDDVGIASVTANGTIGTTTLTSQGSNTWQGTVTAPSTDGTYTVTVVATDTSTNTATNDASSFTVAADATAPTISSVTLSPTSTVSGGSVTVTVVATDASGIASVTANGTTGTVTLTSMGSNEWQGTITAPSAVGGCTVTVVAIDASPNANVVTDTSGLFTVCTNSSTITLSTTGYTLIALPLNDPGINTASDLANRIAGCNEVVKYDETTGTFVSYVSGNPLNDFAIEKGRGYFVNGATVSSVTFYGDSWAS